LTNERDLEETLERTCHHNTSLLATQCHHTSNNVAELSCLTYNTDSLQLTVTVCKDVHFCNGIVLHTWTGLHQSVKQLSNHTEINVIGNTQTPTAKMKRIIKISDQNKSSEKISHVFNSPTLLAEQELLSTNRPLQQSLTRFLADTA